MFIMEVALAKWLVQIDEEMKGILFCPNNDAVAGKLVRSETKADETWRQLEVEVKRYYGIFYIIIYFIFNCIIYKGKVKSRLKSIWRVTLKPMNF